MLAELPADTPAVPQTVGTSAHPVPPDRRPGAPVGRPRDGHVRRRVRPVGGDVEPAHARSSPTPRSGSPRSRSSRWSRGSSSAACCARSGSCARPPAGSPSPTCPSASPVTGKDDLSNLARTVNAMLDRLERAFGSQRELLDDVGHELRTPLTIVRGHLELVDADDPDDVARHAGARPRRARPDAAAGRRPHDAGHGGPAGLRPVRAHRRRTAHRRRARQGPRPRRPALGGRRRGRT